MYVLRLMMKDADFHKVVEQLLHEVRQSFLVSKKKDALSKNYALYRTSTDLYLI